MLMNKEREIAMAGHVKKEFVLEGLDCMNCATKIEERVGKVQGVAKASVNFIASTLTLEVDEGSQAAVVEEAHRIIKKLEPHVVVTEKAQQSSCCDGHHGEGQYHGHPHHHNDQGCCQQGSECCVVDNDHHSHDSHEDEHRHFHGGEVCCGVEPQPSNGSFAAKVAGDNEVLLILKGLGCANCAGKIQDQTQKLPGVVKAQLDFATQKLWVTLEHPEDREKTMDGVKALVKKLEPEVEVLTPGEFNHVKKQRGAGLKGGLDEGLKRTLIFFALGLGFYAGALLLEVSPWLRLSLYLISYLCFGGEVVWQAFRNILRGEIFDENFLMTIATFGAFVVGEYSEGVAVMLFYQIGEMFQSFAVNRSRASIVALMDIRPDYANLRLADGEQRVAPEAVKVGQQIIVRPGEKIPLDGKILEGTSMVDTTALTGESLPRDVASGDEVLAGFINKNGLLIIEVTKAFKESTVSKILDMVENAAGKKAPTEKFITKFSRYYTPAVTGLAALLAIVPPLVIPAATFSDWFYRALIFLVISCPCALVVSIPLGFFGGIGGASRNGILIKGSNYLEALNKVDTIVFDKTGTLTKGQLKVTDIVAKNGFSREALLRYVAHAEAYSNHPIAESITSSYGASIDLLAVGDYEELPGKGVKAVFEGKQILAGNARLMEAFGIPYETETQVGSVVHVAIDNTYGGHLIIADEVKEDSQRAIQMLKAMGIKETIMLTGDSRAVGEQVGAQLGLDKVYSQLLPDQKVEELERLTQGRSPQSKVIFVGDGINDAPVLARADVGVAMGGLGSDAAIEAADVVLMTDEPLKLVTALKIAKKTRRIVWQNIAFAMGVKLIVLILGAGGIATMWEAVFADVGVALLAILNAIRAMKVEPV